MSNRETLVTAIENAKKISEEYAQKYILVPLKEADMIVALLKEQEPKAIEHHDNPFTGLPVAHCPNCKRYARQFHASVEEETHYCPWCGQAVKWE